MIVSLICSDDYRNVVYELLENRGITINDDPNKDDEVDIILIEKNIELANIKSLDKIAVLFDYLKINELTKFIDYLNSNTLNPSVKSIYLGKKENESYEVIKPNDIYYFVADDNEVFLKTKSTTLEVKKKLYELENELSNKSFVRINKSYLINIMMVSEIIPWFGRKLLIRFKGISDELEVSRNYVKNFKKVIGL